jgi:hypothetical protein
MLSSLEFRDTNYVSLKYEPSRVSHAMAVRRGFWLWKFYPKP